MNSTRYISIFKAFSILFILGLLTACSHTTEPYDGPSIIDQFGDFESVEPLGVSMNEVDFGGGEKVFFTAKFNKNVEWQIIIVGQSSGARHVLSGLSRELTEDNALWDGSTTDLPTFGAEECEATLLIVSEDSFSENVMVKVLSGKEYVGELATDFETEPGDNIFLGNFEFELTPATGISSDIPAGRGEKYYYFEGTDNVVPNFFTGLINIKGKITGETYFPLPTSIPDQVYFNAFLYHDARPHTIAVIQFATDTNDNGEFDDGVDQTFQIAGDYPLAWIGWRHIHHPMSDLGISQEQLEKLVAIRVLLISNLNAQPNPPLEVAFGIDNLFFSQGGPIVP